LNRRKPGVTQLPHHDNRWHILAYTLGAILSIGTNTGWCVVETGHTISGVLEEIIVTARKRNETWIDVPVTLTQQDGATLDALQYRNIDEILSLSPGVLVHGGGDSVSPMIVIRGVVSPGELIEPGNAVYVDEVYASGLRTVLPRFYDIQSVQVLKGPQAGLYGRNTMGGAVLITTGQPTNERFARVSASYAQFDAKDVNGTVNIPISASVRLRATAWYNDVEGGYYQSGIVDQNLDTSSENGGRITLAVFPNERTAFTLTGEISETDGSAFTITDGVVDGAQLAPAALGPESRRNVLRDDIGRAELDTARIYGKFDVDMDVGSIIAVAGWRESKIRLPGSDFDGTAYAASYADFLANPLSPLGTPSPEVYTRDDRDTGLYTELRYLTSDNGGLLRAQIGISYFDETVQLGDEIAPAGDFALILADIGSNGSFQRRVDQDGASWAGFTELIWTPMRTIEVTVDLRYTQERKDLDFRQSATGYYSRPNSPTMSFDTSETFENWSPGITLAYKPDDVLMIFGKYVQGFRPGGFNMLVNNPALLPYDSEEARNYELGLKALLFDRRLDFGASVFYLRIDNAVSPVPDPGELTTFYPLQNAATGETTGLEVDVSARVTEGLSLSASAGAYQNSLAIAGGLGRGQRAYAPDYTASLQANYEHPLTATITGIATLGFRHRHGGLVPPPSADIELDSYNLLDAQLGIRFGQVELAGFVRNVLDDNYVISNYGLTFGQPRYVPYPFTTRRILRDPGAVFGVRMTMTF
jgi:iron complex outermembrane recepter protein